MTKASILIVEDERIVGEDLRLTLQKLGYSVSNLVKSGEEALSIISTDSSPNLVLMDIQLDGNVDGIKTAEIINQKYDLPVVFITSFTDEKIIHKAKLTQPYGYIIKPFDENKLKSTIEITLYKNHMENKLKKNERWLSTVFNCIGDGVIVTDKNDKVKYINGIAAKLTEKVDDSRIEKLDQILELEKLFLKRKDACLTTKKSHHIPISNSISPIKDEKGNYLGKIFVFHDIINRKLAEKALKESEERYRTLFEDSADAIFITTTKGRFLVVNQSTVDLFEYNKEELLQLSFEDLFIIPKEWEEFRRNIEEYGTIKNFEVTLKNKFDDELICLLTATIHRSKNNKILGFQGIVRNITAQKRTEAEKKKMQHQLMQVQKMKAIGILAGGIAHDFNNLLTVIQGNNDIIMQKTDPSNNIFKDLQEIQMATDKASELTNKLLVFSKNKPMKFAAF
ncbi:MAG: PAS domain S-box protein, partial [bacterium]